MATISEVKAGITGKSRANRFQVTMAIPGGGGVVSSFLIKATNFPGKTASAIEVPYRGTKFKVAGDPTQNEWSVEVYAEDFTAYQQFFNWFDKGMNISTFERGNPAEYKADGVLVEQLGNKNATIASMTLNGVWVLSIEDVSFSQDSENTMTTFNVRFSIDSTSFAKA